METKKVRLGIAPEHFVISHDGRWAYVCDREEGAVSIVDLVNNQEVNRIPGFPILPDSPRSMYRTLAPMRLVLLM